MGDPTEAALLGAAEKLGLSPADLSTRFARVAELPFDSGRKKMTTVHRLPGGGVRVICKGAPEAMLTEVITGDTAMLTQAADRADHLARRGFRVSAVAAADRPVPPPTGQMERGLRLLGLIGSWRGPDGGRCAPLSGTRCCDFLGRRHDLGLRGRDPDGIFRLEGTSAT